MKHDENSNKKYLIVGLGNPEPAFVNTPHNVGFNAIDGFAEDREASWKNNKSVSGITAKLRQGDKEVFLLKPLTYMNKSGLSVKSSLQYWKISLSNLLIVQDDSDMPIGKIKFSFDQSSGGHKGLDSIIQALGSQNFTRLKIGVRPPRLLQSGKKHIKAEKFILRPLPDKLRLDIAETARNAVFYWLEEGLVRAMNKYN